MPGVDRVLQHLLGLRGAEGLAPPGELPNLVWIYELQAERGRGVLRSASENWTCQPLRTKNVMWTR